MATILSKIFLLYNLLNSTILFLLPKKLRNYFSPSLYSSSQQQQPLKSHDSDSCAVQSSPATPNVPCKMELDELKNIYQMFDKNGDGQITKKELSDSLESMGIFMSDVDLTLMIEKIDSNNDGCVDFDEFGALYQTIMTDQDGEEDMREAFSVFDQNKDGFISFEELKTVLSSLGLKQGRTVEDCKEMIMKVDVDGDGMVDYTEFKKMMRGGGFAALTN